MSKISIDQAAGAATLLTRIVELQEAITAVQSKGSYPVELRLPAVANVLLSINDKTATIRYLTDLQDKVIAGLEIEFGIVVSRQPQGQEISSK